MKETIENLIGALREELKEYGEMLARLDQQQELVMRRQPQDLLQATDAVNLQAEAITAARLEREQRQRDVSRSVDLPVEAHFSQLIPRLPAEYRPMLQALVQENNDLLGRVQQRARQNHLLLSRAVELNQKLLGQLCPGSQPVTYNGNGRVQAPMQFRPYDAVG